MKREGGKYNEEKETGQHDREKESRI